MSHERIIDDDDIASVRALYERPRGFMLGDRKARPFKLAAALVKMTLVVSSTMKQ
jgi:hypothetical protein